MELYVLFIQREESYEGEFAPEPIAVMDDDGYTSNPGFLNDMKAEQLAESDVVAAKIFRVELQRGAQGFIRDQLLENIPPVKGVDVSVVEE